MDATSACNLPFGKVGGDLPNMYMLSAYMTLRALLRATYVILNNLYSIPTYLLWMAILQPIRNYRPRWYHAIEDVAYSWLLHEVSFWGWTGGYQVVEVGDDVNSLVDSECLLIANHQSTADVPTMMHVCTNASKAPLGRHIYWIMDSLFKYTNFGWVSAVHGDFFIQQGRDSRLSQLIELQKHLEDVYMKRERTWIIMFPEGGFLRKRRHTSQEYARQHGFPVLKHVTLPRTGAMHTVLTTLSPRCTQPLANGFSKHDKDSALVPSKTLKYIIDVTIGYPDGKPLDLQSMVFGTHPPCKTTVHYRVFRAEQVPRDEHGLLQWMYARFAEKDELLDVFYKTGRFPDSPSNRAVVNVPTIKEPRTLVMSDLWCWLINVAFLLSTYLHYRVLSGVAAAIFGLVM